MRRTGTQLNILETCPPFFSSRFLVGRQTSTNHIFLLKIDLSQSKIHCYGYFFECAFSWFCRNFGLCVSGLWNSQSVYYFRLGQYKVFAPSAYWRPIVVKNQIDHFVWYTRLFFVGLRKPFCGSITTKAGVPSIPLIIWMLACAFIALPHFLNFYDFYSFFPVK